MPYADHSLGIWEAQAPIRILIADANAKRLAALHQLATDASPGVVTVVATRTLSDLFVQAHLDRLNPTASEEVAILHVDLLPFDGEGADTRSNSLQALSEVPVVLVGEREDDPRAEAGLAAGAQDYVVLRHLTPAGLRRALANATVRHRMMQQIAASDAHFRVLADAAPVLIWVSDTSKGCIYFNKAWLDFTGRTMAQELGYGWTEGVRRDDYARCVQTYEQAFDARQPFEMEYRLRRYDGMERWVLNRGTPRFSPDGTFHGYSGSCLDITERRLAEEELRTSESRLRELAALVPQIIWMSDNRGQVEYVNERWIEYTGLTQAQSLGQATRAVVHPDDLRREGVKWEEALTTGHPFEGEFRLRALDGSYAWFLVRILPVRNSAGEIVKWFGTSTNIDTRKRAEMVNATLTRVLERLRHLAQSEGAAQVLVAELVTELRLDRCLYGEVDWGAGQVKIHAYWQDGQLQSVRTLPLAASIWPITAAEIAAKRALAVNDLKTDPRTSAAYAAGRVPSGLAAALVAPSSTGERGVELLVMGMNSPRIWTPDEIELAERLTMPVRLALEKARAEQLMVERDMRFQLALRDSPITVFSTDLDLRYTWIYNPTRGWRVDEMIGRRDDEIMASEIAQPVMAFKQQVLDTGAPLRSEFDLTLGRVYGRYDMAADPLYNEQGVLIGTMVVAMDITERTRAEERLAFLAEASKMLSSSLIYEETLQQVAALMVPHMGDWCSVDLVTEQGGVELVAVAHVDPMKVAWARALRRRRPPNLDDSTGPAYVVRTGLPEFYPDIDLAAIIQQVEDEEARRILQEVGFRSVIMAPLTARNQTFGALTLVWSDSDRRYDEADLRFAEELARRVAVAIDNARLYQESLQAESDLRLLNEFLEQRVAERTEELMRSNQELDQFAYVASHDLKAPLRAIDHLATWIGEDSGHLLPDRSRVHLDKMRSRIQRMEALLDDLLAYSRAGRRVGQASLVPLHDLVDQVVETVDLPEGFEITLGNVMPVITTLHVPLETVLRNLLGNAIKHHDRPDGRIDVDAWPVDGGMIEFVVRDDGPGIAPVYHERIFLMFQTLQPRDQREGSGIGLAVVKKIVDSMGGKVWVESQPSQGSAFHFTWPENID